MRRATALPTLICVAGSIALRAQDHSAHTQHAAQKAHNMPAATTSIDATDFKVTKVIKAPDNFMGGLAYDPASNRLWLLSVGPPANTKTSSILYELEPGAGRVIAQAKMPFLGEFGSPVFMDGHLYVGIPHASRLHKIAVSPASEFGKIVKTVRLPTLNDLNETFSEPFRFPFINFPGLAPTPDKKLVLHAEDLGLFLTVDPENGKLLNKVQTLKGLGGTAAATGPGGHPMLLGNADPETTALKRDMRVFMFRSAHGFTPPYAARTEEPCGRSDARDITWALLDPASGEVIASTLDRCSRTKAGPIALVKQEQMQGFPYGQLTFLTVADEGVLTVQWKPRP